MDEIFTQGNGLQVLAVYLLVEIALGVIPARFFKDKRRKLALVVVFAAVISLVFVEYVDNQSFAEAVVALAVQSVFADQTLSVLLPKQKGNAPLSGVLGKLTGTGSES